MNILFCGSCLPREYETKITMLSVAGNQYQNNLISNLKNKGNVHVLSYINIPLEIEQKEIESKCQYEGYTPIFTNNKLVALKEYRQRLKKELTWANIVITYNSMYPWFGVGKMARAQKKRSVLVLADFTPHQEVKSLIRKIYSKIEEFDFRQYSKVVALSEGVKKYILSNQEYELINGCIEPKKFKNITPPVNKGIISVVYTGVLSSVTGVDILVDAMKRISNPNLRLIICGQGIELASMLHDAERLDMRIEYRGFLSTEEYLNLLNEADILVNPRNMNYLQNQNNFPSKILEYLASGRKIVSTKFRGYEKYSDYIVFVDSNAESLAKGIQNAIEGDAVQAFFRNRRLAEKFEWNKQIVKFL